MVGCAIALLKCTTIIANNAQLVSGWRCQYPCRDSSRHTYIRHTIATIWAPIQTFRWAYAALLSYIPDMAITHHARPDQTRADHGIWYHTHTYLHACRHDGVHTGRWGHILRQMQMMLYIQMQCKLFIQLHTHTNNIGNGRPTDLHTIICRHIYISRVRCRSKYTNLSTCKDRDVDRHNNIST